MLVVFVDMEDFLIGIELGCEVLVIINLGVEEYEVVIL